MPTAPFTAMTFNVRYDEPADGPHAWTHRRPLVVEAIRAHAPDLLGLQEPMPNQWSDLTASFPDATPFGRSDRGCEIDPPAGFFRTDRYDAVDSGLFWLSDTPSVPNSVTWPNDWGARACNWVRLRDRLAGRTLVFACTHVDPNPGGWLPSARALRTGLDALGDSDAVVLVGDFNCESGSDAHAYLTGQGGFRDAWTEAGCPDEAVVTFTGFITGCGLPAGATSTNYRIDWILIRGAIGCLSASVDDRHRAGLLPSDHYPVIAELVWT